MNALSQLCATVETAASHIKPIPAGSVYSNSHIIGLLYTAPGPAAAVRAKTPTDKGHSCVYICIKLSVTRGRPI